MKFCVGPERTSVSQNWKGGRYKNSQGYILVYCPEHPNSDHSGYVREHRIVMERHLGRLLLPEERVHHINKTKTDNRIENLMLFSSEAEHQHSVPHRNSEFVWAGRAKEYQHDYYCKNQEQILARCKTYRENHREEINKLQNDIRRAKKQCSI